MAPPKPVFWGPYVNEAEARFCLGAFASRIIGPGAGVIYCDGTGVSFLKKPFYDDDGSGLVLVVSCRAEMPPPSPPPAPHGAWQRIEQFFEKSMQTVGEAQLQNSQAQLAMGQQEAAWIKEGWSSVNEFIEGHKKAADTVAVVGDVFGVIAGVAAGIAIVATGGTVLLGLAAVAGVASAFLLYEDGSVLSAELSGDEMRQKKIESTWHYKVVELVGPLLLLPDLIASGPKALTSLAKAPKEVSEAGELVAHGKEALAAQREAIADYQETNASKLAKKSAQTKLQKMRAGKNKLVKALQEAQKALDEAQKEFIKLGTLDVPAYGFSTYAAGLYAFAPPDCAKELMHTGSCDLRPAPEGHPNAQDPAAETRKAANPMNLLVPDGMAQRRTLLANSHMNFQVAISRNGAVAK